MKPLICLDPGHGGNDRSNRGPTGYIEADGVLDIALKARNILKEFPVRIIMTRVKDETVSLEERVRIANDAKADIFVSIHTNAADTPVAEGLETYHSIYSRPGEGGHKLAVCIQEELCRATNRKSRGIKTRKGSDGRDYYYVIRCTSMPAVIVECGFHTNPTEEHLLKTDAYRLLCAQGIAKGILRYFDIKKEENNKDKMQFKTVNIATVDIEPFLIHVPGGERICVSLRDIVELAGGAIEKWDEKTQTAVAVIGKRRLTIQVGNPKIQIEEEV